jgi:formylglycine-generating enzyme required for sulfatase activity
LAVDIAYSKRSALYYVGSGGKESEMKCNSTFGYYLSMTVGHRVFYIITMNQFLRFWLLLTLVSKVFAYEQATAVTRLKDLNGTWAVIITSSGSGYCSEPYVYFRYGGGYGAAGRAVVEDGKVVDIIVTNPGANYGLNPPQVVIESPIQSGPCLFIDLQPVSLVAQISVSGETGGRIWVERASGLMGPWSRWTNILIPPSGTFVIQERIGSDSFYYRAAKSDLGPPGFVKIPDGVFIMGSPLGESLQGKFTDEIQHSVTIQTFWISDHEVTQSEYQSIMGNNPSGYIGSDRPVERVGWNDAVLYCQKLTERERLAGRIRANQTFRLPREAEWEYAARAGNPSARYGDLNTIAWWKNNSINQTHIVKQKTPNAWGLYDMLGNVEEWCSDWYGPYSVTDSVNPTGPLTGTRKIYRGGSFTSDSENLRAASRNKLGGEPYSFASTVGFRVVLTPD